MIRKLSKAEKKIFSFYNNLKKSPLKLFKFLFSSEMKKLIY